MPVQEKIKDFFTDTLITSEKKLKERGFNATKKEDKLKAKYPEMSYEQYKNDIVV